MEIVAVPQKTDDDSGGDNRCNRRFQWYLEDKFLHSVDGLDVIGEKERSISNELCGVVLRNKIDPRPI